MQYHNPCDDHCLSLTVQDFDTLTEIGDGRGPVRGRWVSTFCSQTPGACTLDPGDRERFILALKRLIPRYRAACDMGNSRAVTARLEDLLWTVFEPIDRPVNREEAACVCPMEWRLSRGEALGPVLR